MKKTLLTLLLSVFGATVFAQPAGPGASGINAALLSFFGDAKAFSSKADVRVIDSAGKEKVRIPMQMFVLDGKMRAEMDLSQMKGGDMPPEAVFMLKQTGMDKMVTVVRPDKQLTLILYPGLQAYAEVPMSPEEASAKDLKVEKTAAGNEIIDGHPCSKNKITVTAAKGKKQEATVWNASDLKDFPIQVQIQEAKMTTTILQSEPKFEKPAASLFDAPAGFTKHANMQALMQAAMLKMIGGGK
ncbi:MAG: DUF4412 domain-containing protein [Pedosphaera sp.]|nr:DUF4412 domain-containing protein [Pedosphaera sp.]